MTTRGDRPTILITGASGVIGQALFEELTDHRLVCLTHRATLDRGYQCVAGDVTGPRLGMAHAEYARLVRTVDVVIHCAALTDWAAPIDQLQAVNVTGMENILRLAYDADAPLYWVGTAFIRALAGDAAFQLTPDNVILNYVRTKAECEALVQASDVPHTIFRPTNLIGDSRTGRISATQAPQLVAELVCRGRLPLFPARPGVLVDVVPQDLVARLIVAAVEAEDIGSAYWITGGAEAMSAPEVLEICVSFMERIGRPVARPRLVHPEEIDPAEVARLAPSARAFFGRVLELTEGQAACGVFPSSLGLLREQYELPEFTFQEAFENGLAFWALTKGLLPEHRVVTPGPNRNQRSVHEYRR